MSTPPAGIAYSFKSDNLPTPRGIAHNYNLDNLPFPRVLLGLLELPMLSSEVRTWGELLTYVRANSWNLPEGTFEHVQDLKIQYANAGPAVPLVPPAGTTSATATSAPNMPARGRGKRGLRRAGGRAGRQATFGAQRSGSHRSTTTSKPTPVAQQSEGLAQVALPSRRVLPAPPAYEHALSVPQEPVTSRGRQVAAPPAPPAPPAPSAPSAPSQIPARSSSLIRISPPRKGSVVLKLVPGSNPKAGPKVLRSYTSTPVVVPSAMIRMAPGAQPVPVISHGAVESPKDRVETKTKAIVRGSRDPSSSSSIIDSEIPANVSEALAVFPSLRPIPGPKPEPNPGVE